MEEIVDIIRKALDEAGISMDKIEGEDRETYGLESGRNQYLLTIEPV